MKFFPFPITTMNKEVLYRWMIGGLFVGNLLLLGYLFFGKKWHSHKHHESREMVLQKLNLTPAQQNQFDTLFYHHRTDIRKLQTRVADKKRELYALLHNPSNDSIKVQLTLNQVIEIQREIELSHFNHFKALRQILNPSQLPAFTELVSEIQDHVHRHHHRKSHSR